MNLRTIRLFNVTEVMLGDRGKRQRVLLLPDGDIAIRDGTKLLVDKAGAEAAIETFRSHGVDIPFDINHSTVLKAPRGEESPAFGWGKEIIYEPGTGLLCDVEWTDAGYEKIKAGQYKYLSPTVRFEEQTGRVRVVHSAALTTTPATPGMPALAAMYVPNSGEQKIMDGLINKMLQEEGMVATAEQKIGELKALLESLGAELGDGADFVTIINAAIAQLKGDGDEKKEKPADGAGGADAAVAASVRVKLGLAADADGDTVIKALSDLQGHMGLVPATELAKVVKRLDEVESREAEGAAKSLVETYLSEGKLLATDDAKMKWARERAKDDPEGFKILMDDAPVIVPQGRTRAPAGGGASPPPNGRTGLIALSSKEFDDAKASGTMMLNTRQQWIDGALRHDGHKTLTDEEVRKLD